MARIRTIKPEFWTDEKIVRLPFEARLLFIGIWNFADDDGFIRDEPDRIRLQIFPADASVDVDGMLDLLFSAELLEKVSLKDGEYAFRVTGFKRHQSISHASQSRIAPEVTGKVTVSREERRKLAIKYGCKPGTSLKATCYCCGLEGLIFWHGAWVGFSGLEISHFQSEAKGGASACGNLVLGCRFCNRSMHTDNPVSLVGASLPEDSGGLRPEREGKRREGEREKEGNSKGDRKTIGSSTSPGDGNGQPPPVAPVGHSPKNAHRGRQQGEPFDLSAVDWDRVTAWAERTARKIPPRTTDDRRMWFRFGVLADMSFGEAWLVDAVEAVLNARDTKTTKRAHLVAVLKSKAEEEHGVSDQNFVAMLRRIEIPKAIWKSNAVEIQK